MAADVGVAAAAPPSGEILPAGTDAVVADSYVVVLKDGQQGVDTAVRTLAGRYGGKVGHVFRRAVHGFEVSMDEAAAKRLAADSAVQYVQRNGLYRISGIETSAPWGLDRIDQRNRPLDGSYTYPNTAGNVHAYILDTGIRFSHTDLGGRAATGFDAITAGGTAADCNGHGTHVAGTVGGSSYGVAKGSQLVAVRVLDCSGSGSTAQVVAGIDWVTANAVKPAVANMSLGGPGDTILDSAVANSINSGVTYAVSAGNGDARGNPLNACTASPARVPAAITVGATDVNDNRASFSNYGSCVDIFAPGVGITSSWFTGDTAKNTISGTSMAAPHVTGAAALVASANPSWTPQQISDYLVSNATDGVVVNPGTSSPNKLLHVVNSTPSNDFSMSASPASQTVEPGESTSATVSSTTTAGSAQVVSLSVSGLPSGATASFSPASITSGGSSTISITTSASTPSGNYGITVIGTGSTTTRTALFTLAVNSPEGSYFPLAPSRILDTREGNGAPTGPLGPNQTLHLQVTGRGGVPATGVSTVLLNVTVTGPTSAGYLTVFPAGVARPTASNLNFTAGWTGANSVTVQVGAGGKVDIFNPAGNVSVIADVVGYYATAAHPTTGGDYWSDVPIRYYDSREDGGPLDPFGGVLLPLDYGDELNPHIRAVAVNLTTVDGSAGGYLTAWNGTSPRPTASTVNFGPRAVVSNFAVVPTALCTYQPSCYGLPQIAVYNGSGGTTHVIVDIVGFYDDGFTGQGLRFHPITPTRITDTRIGLGANRLQPNSNTVIQAPNAVTNQRSPAIVANVTGVDPSNSTYLALYAYGDGKPDVSNLNLTPHEVRPNVAYIALGDNGKYVVYNAAWTVDVVIDVAGTFELQGGTALQASGSAGAPRFGGTGPRPVGSYRLPA
ncbi:S8 family serine peptidase [Dactylosporangium cerinum]|uniref:S8 family serine peptidase n=1 Tax=Dactylosporangium cerinum TaxID=1434730 RepID=A0ABV9VRE5_9ACTN